MKKIITQTFLALISFVLVYTFSSKVVDATTLPENIEYWVSPKVVHIKNDDTLKLYLQTDSNATKDLVLDTKELYFSTYLNELQVSNRSMYVEIIGHVFPDTVAKYLPDWLASIIIKHTSIIDSGESSVDSNRWVWDSIAFVIEDFQNPISVSIFTESSDNIANSIYERYSNLENVELDREIMKRVVEDIKNNNIDLLLLQ